MIKFSTNNFHLNFSKFNFCYIFFFTQVFNYRNSEQFFVRFSSNEPIFITCNLFNYIKKKLPCRYNPFIFNNHSYNRLSVNEIMLHLFKSVLIILDIYYNSENYKLHSFKQILIILDIYYNSENCKMVSIILILI